MDRINAHICEQMFHNRLSRAIIRDEFISKNSLVTGKLIHYMSKRGLRKLDDFSIEDIIKLNEETQIPSEILRYISNNYHIDLRSESIITPISKKENEKKFFEFAGLIGLTAYVSSWIRFEPGGTLGELINHLKDMPPDKINQVLLSNPNLNEAIMDNVWFQHGFISQIDAFKMVLDKIEYMSDTNGVLNIPANDVITIGTNLGFQFDTILDTEIPFLDISSEKILDTIDGETGDTITDMIDQTIDFVIEVISDIGEKIEEELSSDEIAEIVKHLLGLG